MRPDITIYNCETDEKTVREMTEEEYADLLATGWTLEGKDETPIAH
jgi:hypothetical protein